MNDSQHPPAANDGPTSPQPDPEIEALLNFEPVPRKVKLEGGWTPERQGEFIRRLAVHGSPGMAASEVGMDVTGARKLYRSPLGASFRAAWDGMVEIAHRRRAEAAPVSLVEPGTRPPSVDNRKKRAFAILQAGPREGQMLNEHGEWEDEDSLDRRAEEARDSITMKLLNARRLYLGEICDSPGKRAAFEILTELPIDWDKAGRLEPQPDEPWRNPNMREPDMLLTAENGWLGDCAHGPDKKAVLRKALDEHRAEEGLEPVDWSEAE